MSDNGDGKVLVKVELGNGGIRATFGQCNLALISHALRVASLELDNIIIAHKQKKEEKPLIVMPKTILDKLR